MKKVIIPLFVAAATLTACINDSTMVNHNITQDAENFKIARRIVFVNGITDKYLLSVEGYCNINDDQGQLEVICKDGGEFKKHFLGLSDNVTYFSEQISGANVSDNFYKVVFKPSVIVPDVEVH
ncbi:hypothetical protein FRC0456_01057 [Corynebacterium diphtheriae]|uniref:beta-sandwich lipoprotein n=1 Tax=Corynebacterium diphtheriae TaxID=1717 RepID=UPI000D06CDE8|nr:hypothetical protein [Corynebacterium diphtheriae]MBG9335738.1 hypothetical protein [Corynebacterium diphtheriae bv. gravis]PSA74282.1 hypothetical protein BT092_04820 [Corynebacterium diphtheriae]CAB0503841.1 hypothetical protein FRC061569_00931 [Corynebacterium diphtheriae]CAB0507718.1 hypothetical protein FRC020322_01173 [Corynebacterium diphtheriae]CAB0507956.1 hypothetical protein FRC031641_01170 [Corynebacterium diphtheriae]